MLVATAGDNACIDTGVLGEAALQIAMRMVLVCGYLVASAGLCAAAQEPVPASQQSPKVQTPAVQTEKPIAEKQDQPAVAAPVAAIAVTNPSPDVAAPAQAQPKTYTVPAGTKVLLALKSAVNTKSAKPGDGVYLVSTFPVVVGTRVLIPSGVYVQGVVDNVERHIRVKGHAKLTMHFTSMIFPNGTVVEMPGAVNSLPGSKGPKVKGEEGTVEQQGDLGQVASDTVKGAATGAGIGAIGGAVNDSPVQGAGLGAAAGGVAGALYSLFTHGNDIDIEQGTPLEMVLQRPLILEDANLQGGAEAINPPGLTPAAHQPQPMPKSRIPQLTCAPGSVGCS